MERLAWQPEYDGRVPFLLQLLQETEDSPPEVLIEPRSITDRDFVAWELEPKLIGGVALCLAWDDDIGERYYAPWHFYTRAEWDAFRDGCMHDEFNLRADTEPFDKVPIRDSKVPAKPALELWAVEWALLVEAIRGGEYEDPLGGFSSPHSLMPLRPRGLAIDTTWVGLHTWTNRLRSGTSPVSYRISRPDGRSAIFITD